MSSCTTLLVIDPQNDFCDLPEDWRAVDPLRQTPAAPALPVSGAHADMLRLAALIDAGGEGIHRIVVTLDSHQRYDIAHPTFWQTGEGAAESGLIGRETLERAVVLVVEDEASVRSMVRRSLEAVGLTVVEAKNGREALDVVASRAERPKLVLTDVIMPELNGRELSEALASSQPELPVLFMSGYTGEDVLARSLLPETAQFIQKPFAPEELVARVRTLLSESVGPPTSPQA